ncbi:MAG: BON domain-containing protein [Proteobacteria bacterium]|nr:BON domain-containing protein [Pseudomonadota bacterium]MBU1386280.1 BON domain-containing protein [Pseudomonadota bacterium]MBU1542972.1 BON domain-containing protein [Pseudomonadota bacterium]MBU2479995.1 BON domain-containing protein [Pseudomonadota bacterium]
MKTFLCFMLLLFMVPLLNSCGTIYGAAVDERNVSTIASDHQIKAGILKKFTDDELVGVLDFSVSSYEGHVYLIGEYKTTAQKNRAIELAKKEEGVTGMTTYLIPENPKAACGTAQNLELTAKVKAKLIGDKDIWSTNIDVKTMQCITVLWGLVGSKVEIEKAIRHARSVKGVSQVKSFLKAVK